MSSPPKSPSHSPVPDLADQNGAADTVAVPGKDSASEIQPENRPSSPVPVECAIEVSDLEEGSDEKDCRICHLSLEAPNQDPAGTPIELGCSCKDDLAAAHRQCAEAWFKIKGNLTCEICGSVAQNVSIANESTDRWENLQAADATTVITIPVIIQPRLQSRNFWPGHRFLNFLLACMVFAFIISWLFHFNFPS